MLFSEIFDARRLIALNDREDNGLLLMTLLQFCERIRTIFCRGGYPLHLHIQSGNTRPCKRGIACPAGHFLFRFTVLFLPLLQYDYIFWSG